MKQTTKKTKKIKKELTSNEFGIILEEMNSKIDILLEGYAISEEKFERLDKKIDTKIDDLRKEMHFRFQCIDDRLDGIDSNFKTVFKFLSQIDNELKLIKKELKNKADLVLLKTLEKRIKKLEINYTELHSLILQQYA